MEVFRRRGKRNPRLLNASLVTFSAPRKSPRGATGSETLQKAAKNRRHSTSKRIQAERHVRSAVCLLPTNTVQRNCRSYFIVKSKRQNASEGQKNTTKTAESAVSLHLAFLCNSDILESRMTRQTRKTRQILQKRKEKGKRK